jgi:hypothetical protein
MPDGGYHVRYDDGEEVPSLREYLRLEGLPQSVAATARDTRGTGGTGGAGGIKGAGGAGGGAGDNNDYIDALKAEILLLRQEASENDTTKQELVNKVAKQKSELKSLSESHARLDKKAEAYRNAKDSVVVAQDGNDHAGCTRRVFALESHITILRERHLVKVGNQKKSIHVYRPEVVRDLHAGLGKAPSSFLKETYGT